MNSTGAADDVAPDVKAFLDYVNGVLSDDAFVREIDDEIIRVKQIEQERVGYMTYAMKIEEERELAEEKGREEGKIETVINNIRSLMKKKGWSFNEALEALDVSPEDRVTISAKL
ncbi:MAG: hypothetical protein IJT82_04685 [Schwartzia sp.]|nr:hypothetical protein [Schwartzia sp. (in: firmicutes)]